jgi:hypothetical protein
VKRAANDNTNRIDAALMLNFLCRCGLGSSPVYPGVQFGIGTGKDAPSLLVGALLRFTGKPFSIMAGRIATWSNDLNKLKVGDVVAGTEAIESDLKLKRQPTATYIGVQYTFK